MNRLLISCTYFSPNVSGVTVYAEILAREMAAFGNKVVVLTSQYKEGLAKAEILDGVEIRRSKVLFRWGKGLFLPCFFKDSVTAVKESDVVNCHLPQVESCILAILAKYYHKKLVITHHCEFNFSGTMSNRLIALLTYPFHLISYVLADEIVSYTSDYAQTSMFLKNRLEKVKFILPPVIVGKENRDKINKIKADIGNGDQKIVGFVGRIGWEKGINYLIEAMKTIEAKLVLVGPSEEVVGDDSYKKIRNMADEKVIFYGPMAHDDLVNFYNICDCLVLPSTNNLETFGIVQAEAMVCGCPVVASNLPGVRVPVKLTGMGAIAKVGDVMDLRLKIERVLQKGRMDGLKAKKIFNLVNFIEGYKQCLN